MKKCQQCNEETYTLIKSHHPEINHLWLCYRCSEKEDIRIRTNWITDKEYDLAKLDKIIKGMEKRIKSLEGYRENQDLENIY